MSFDLVFTGMTAQAEFGVLCDKGEKRKCCTTFKYPTNQYLESGLCQRLYFQKDSDLISMSIRSSY